MVFQSRQWAHTFNSEEFRQPVFVGLEDVMRDESEDALKAPKVIIKRGAPRVKRMGAAEGGTKCSKAEKERQKQLAEADAPSDGDDSEASVDPDDDPEQDLEGVAPEEENGNDPEDLGGVRVPSPEPSDTEEDTGAPEEEECGRGRRVKTCKYCKGRDGHQAANCPHSPFAK